MGVSLETHLRRGVDLCRTHDKPKTTGRVTVERLSTRNLGAGVSQGGRREKVGRGSNGVETGGSRGRSSRESETSVPPYNDDVPGLTVNVVFRCFRSRLESVGKSENSKGMGRFLTLRSTYYRSHVNLVSNDVSSSKR